MTERGHQHHFGLRCSPQNIFVYGLNIRRRGGLRHYEGRHLDAAARLEKQHRILYGVIIEVAEDDAVARLELVLAGD